MFKNTHTQHRLKRAVRGRDSDTHSFDKERERQRGRDEVSFFSNSVTVLTVDGWECHCGQREGITRHEAN